MTAQPRFSVVTIVRDGETHLAEAVASVRDQSVEDWELHIVDDGSIDGTLDLATRLAEEDSER
ncbi:MAG: glycosyltransferase family 2 protein, partial [Planctomycetota bacterium]